MNEMTSQNIPQETTRGDQENREMNEMPQQAKNGDCTLVDVVLRPAVTSKGCLLHKPPDWDLAKEALKERLIECALEIREIQREYSELDRVEFDYCEKRIDYEEQRRTILSRVHSDLQDAIALEVGIAEIDRVFWSED